MSKLREYNFNIRDSKRNPVAKIQIVAAELDPGSGRYEEIYRVGAICHPKDMPNYKLFNKIIADRRRAVEYGIKLFASKDVVIRHADARYLSLITEGQDAILPLSRELVAPDAPCIGKTLTLMAPLVDEVLIANPKNEDQLIRHKVIRLVRVYKDQLARLYTKSSCTK